MNCTAGAVWWIERYFGDCIYTTKDMVSFAIGLSSICLWIPAQVPQLWLNYKEGRVEAISPIFLINWALGDSTNLAGCILSQQLATQLYTAIYFCILDVFMLTQYFYYTLCRPRCCPQLDPERASLLKAAAVGSLVAGAHALSVRDLSPTDPLAIAGAVLGWVSAFMYLSSRLPQIIKNFRRSSVEGLSWKMFMFAMLGNTTYGLSIFLRSTESAFLMARLPWILGSVGTLAFDTIILSQFVYYNVYMKRNEKYLVVNSDEADDPQISLKSVK